MELAELLEAARPYLSDSGFGLTGSVTTRRDGRPLPFGDQQWIFAARGLDFEIVRDRGSIWVALGLAGQGTLAYQAWALAVGIPFENDLGLLEQVRFFTSELARLSAFVDAHADADALVRAENWKLVASQIQQDPHQPPPGSR